MNVLQHQTRFLFTRNPIIFEVDRWIHGVSGSFSVVLNEEDTFKGRFSAPSEINVAQIVDAMTPPLPWHDPEGDFVQCLESGIKLNERSFEIITHSEDKGLNSIYTFFAIPGGVPVQHDQIDPQDTPINSRFQNKSGNRFLTVRSSEWIIEIPEEEVHPLYFLSYGTSTLTFSFQCMPDNISEEVTTGIYCLDITALRKFVFENYGSIPSVIDISFGGTPARIVITKQSPSKNRQKVLFINSLGAPELYSFEPINTVESTGPLEQNENYLVYNSSTSLFVKASQRSILSKKHNYNIVIKSEAEATLLLEMLNSDNCWLQNPNGWIKAVPSYEKLEIQNEFKSPQNISFELTESQSDMCMLPPVGKSYSIQPNRFSNNFSKEFK